MLLKAGSGTSEDSAVEVREDWAWTWEEPGHWGATVHAGRFEDDNGDGVVDVSDRLSLWVAAYSLYGSSHGHFLLDASGDVTREDALYAGTYRTWAGTPCP